MQPKHVIILKSTDGLDDALSRLKGGPLAIDTEFTRLEWWRQRDGSRSMIGSIQLAARDTAVFAWKDALGPVARYLGDEVKRERELVFHNAKIDMHQLRESFGLHIPYPVHDTHLQSFLLDNRGANAHGWRTKKPHSLKQLVDTYTDFQMADIEKELMASIRANGGKHKGDWLLADPRIMKRYGWSDVWGTLQLHLIQHPCIVGWSQPWGWEKESLLDLYKLEQWCILAFRDMEQRGILCNQEFLEEWRVTLEKELAGLRRQLWKLAGKKEINWNSRPQLANLLFSKRSAGGLGLTPVKYTKGGKKKGPQPSTDSVSMLDLNHPFGPVYVKYSETFKQWSSYATSLQEAIAYDDAIHPTFKSTGAETGRTSCEHPNLQQMTRMSGVRKAYYPRKGLQFRFADYSQVEFRMAAHFSGEPSLIEGYCNDPDFDSHVDTAVGMFGSSYAPDRPELQHRKFAKILNFTTIFGGGVKKITEQLVNLMEYREAVAGCKFFGIAKSDYRQHPWRALSVELKKRYQKKYPKMMKELRDGANRAEEEGFSMHDFGGHRYFDDRFYRDFNTRVQGTAGIQAKRGLVGTYQKQLSDGDLGMMLLIHDEIVYESEGNPRTDRDVLEIMKEPTRFKVPIIAEMSGATTNWQEKFKVDLKTGKPVRKKAA